ncbi:hypothetical protein MMC13_005026 [Lambiella insularis]|nr:hypothetical protein [Lambiella insularis]
MADLLSTLLVPKGSQDSFHSASSQPAVPSPPLQPATHPAHGLVLHDVSAYLDLPASKSLLGASTKIDSTKDGPKSQAKPSSTARDAIIPVQLSSATSSASVSRFYHLCQEKGLTPVWEIEADAPKSQWFKGKVSVGTQMVVLEGKAPSKKEARQILAERGCEVVGRMEARVKRGNEGGDGDNWIGRLLEFSNATPTLPGPTFTDYALGTGFACECVISQRAVPFGGTDALFGSKKAAKMHAAREAVEFLIQEGHLEQDGNVKRRKKAKLGLGVKGVERGEDAGVAAGAEGEKSWGQRVNELALDLNLAPPTYQLTPSNPALASNIFSGAAYFANEPLHRGPIGEVRNVFGRKNAREECARGVFAWMEELRERRLAALDM